MTSVVSSKERIQCVFEGPIFCLSVLGFFFNFEVSLQCSSSSQERLRSCTTLLVGVMSFGVRRSVRQAASKKRLYRGDDGYDLWMMDGGNSWLCQTTRTHHFHSGSEFSENSCDSVNQRMRGVQQRGRHSSYYRQTVHPSVRQLWQQWLGSLESIISSAHATRCPPNHRYCRQICCLVLFWNAQQQQHTRALQFINHKYQLLPETINMVEEEWDDQKML